MNDLVREHKRAVVKAAFLALLVLAVLTGIAYAVALRLAGQDLASDVVVAGAVLLLAGVPGFVLAVALTGKLRGGASIGFIAGIGVRMPVGGVLALYGLNWGLAKTASFTQVVAAAYLFFLVIEVLVMSPAVKRTAASEINAPSDEAAGAKDYEESF